MIKSRRRRDISGACGLCGLQNFLRSVFVVLLLKNS